MSAVNYQLARWWEKENGKIRCTLCPRYCRLKNKQIGFCAVRQNIDGKLYALAYNHPLAINIDPVEKKPLYHFLPGTQILSIGTAGCNLACKFCQNWSMSTARFNLRNSYNYNPEEIVALTIKNKCSSIAFTYNEPTIFAEYALDISLLAREKGLKTAMVTNGYITTNAINDLYPYIDAANIDLKAMDREFYRKWTSSKLEAVLEAIKEIYRLGTWIEITNLIIPELNDDERRITSLVEWVLDNLGSEVPIHFTAFHPSHKVQDRSRTPKSTLDRAVQIAREKGMKYIYEGNVLTHNEGNTYCPSCGKLLIERAWYYTAVHFDLNKSRCDCGAEIEGVFK